MSMVCKVAGKTDRGLVRPGNEDCLHIDKRNNVFAVYDGMGGHQAGEVASMTASEIMSLAFNHFKNELLEEITLKIGRTFPESGDLLVKSIRLANREIHNRAKSEVSMAGMGTTVVAVALESDYMSIAHVGDSRAYQIGERNLVPLTVDHSWVQELQDSQGIKLNEAEVSVGRNVITRALGVRKDVEVDYRLVKVKPGDKYLLCSDGLCGFADDDEIFDVIKTAEGDIVKMADSLIKMANDRGGMDNVSVVVLEIVDVKESPLEPADMVTIPQESSDLLTAEDKWLEQIKKRQSEIEIDQIEKQSNNQGKKSTIVAIFAVFLILVFVIIYFVAGK
jgi:protein phosphatase